LPEKGKYFKYQEKLDDIRACFIIINQLAFFTKEGISPGILKTTSPFNLTNHSNIYL